MRWYLCLICLIKPIFSASPALVPAREERTHRTCIRLPGGWPRNRPNPCKAARCQPELDTAAAPRTCCGRSLQGKVGSPASEEGEEEEGTQVHIFHLAPRLLRKVRVHALPWVHHFQHLFDGVGSIKWKCFDDTQKLGTNVGSICLENRRVNSCIRSCSFPHHLLPTVIRDSRQDKVQPFVQRNTNGAPHTECLLCSRYCTQQRNVKNDPMVWTDSS